MPDELKIDDQETGNSHLWMECSLSLDLEAAPVPVTEPETGGPPKVISPQLAKFRMVGNTGAPMKLSGWKYPVVMDLDGMKIERQNIPIRLGHDPMQGVGHTESVGIKDGKLIASVLVSRTTDAAREVRDSAKNGFPWKASIGASTEDVEFVKAGDRAQVNGQEYEGPLNIARKSTLGEISFVDMGADPHTDALIAAPEPGRIAASKDGEGSTELALTVGTEIERNVKATRDALDLIEANRTRVSAIKAIALAAAENYGISTERLNELAAKAIQEGWTPDKFELETFRGSRAKVPQLLREAPTRREVLEASLCLSAGISDESLVKDRDYGEDVVSEAYRYRNRGLRGTICAALEAMGVRVPHGSREMYDSILENQHRGRIEASGFSTINLPGILGNVANKILIEAFTKVNATYDRIADQADFSNFHIHAIYRLESTGDFALVPNDGQIKSGALEQDSYTNKLDTYGRMLTITRQDIINDDLNAFRSLTAQLARKARIAVEKALYLLVAEASDTFYTVARGNRFTSSSLGIPEMAQAESALLSMTDTNGDPIYATPRFILVPSTLKYFADQLYTSQLVNDFTTGQARPTDNPFRARFEVISTPFLNSSVIPGNSTTTWYLIADPLMLPAFQVCYLDGRREPTIETKEAQFNTLGLQMRAYWDFGVAQLDYRGAVKSTA